MGALHVEGALEGYVPSHVEDSPSACRTVYVGMFQSAEVVLVGTVGEVVAVDADGGNASSFYLDVSADGSVEQGV